MDIKSIWIGEKILIKSSGKIGVFSGTNKENKARIKVGDKILLVPSSNIEIIPEKEIFPNIDDLLQEDEQIETKKSKKFTPNINHTLDLHIDKLAPHMENNMPARILEYQLEVSEKFVKDAIHKNYPHITIIHGKGQGVLKQAIEHQLKQFGNIKMTFTKNNGGAVEIWL